MTMHIVHPPRGQSLLAYCGATADALVAAVEEECQYAMIWVALHIAKILR